MRRWCSLGRAIARAKDEVDEQAQQDKREGAQPLSEENEGPPRSIRQIPDGHSVDIRGHELRSVEEPVNVAEKEVCHLDQSFVWWRQA